MDHFAKSQNLLLNDLFCIGKVYTLHLSHNINNMTSKEKAKELYLKYTDTLNIRDLQTTANPFAKQCALIAVDELIYNCYEVMKPFWKEVKQEIEKL